MKKALNLLGASLILVGLSGCDLEEVEDTVVANCEGEKSGCSPCCKEEGFDWGSYDIMEDTCFCKTSLEGEDGE